MKQVLVISFSDLGRDPRVDRQLLALEQHYEVIAAGLGPPAAAVGFVDLRLPVRSRVEEILRQGRSLTRLLRGRYDEVYWSHPQNRAAASRLASVKPDLLIANDLSALPLARRIANSAPVVFDAHELAPEEHADRRWWRLLIRPYVDSLLRMYLPGLAGMTTVAPGVAAAYADRYGVRPVVLTNAPPRAELEPSEVGSPIRLIHHGASDRQRHLELMLETVDQLDDRFELDLMLVPTARRYHDEIVQKVSRMPRVRLIEPVPQRDIVAHLNRYDVGLYLLPPRNANLRHALPNKLFEFIQARLAVAIGPSPEMAKIVNRYGCGVVAESFQPRSLAEAISALDSESVSALKRQAGVAAVEMNAERNAELLLSLVERALHG